MDNQGTKPNVWSWEVAGALCCFTGGMGAALLGCLLTAITWVLGEQLHPWLHGIGTALFIVTIPLLILSGYCLDWEERGSKRAETREGAGQR